MAFLILKILLTALVVVSATVVAERLKPVWGGILTTIPLSSGAAFVMLSMTESAQFLANAALASLVTSMAAFAYLAVFVNLATRRPAHVAVGAAFLTWLVLSSLGRTLDWTLWAAALGNVVAFLLCRQITLPYRVSADTGNRMRPPLHDIMLRGLAVGLLATIVSVAGRYVGPGVAGMLAVFPMVYVTVAFIVHRRMGGATGAATMASAVTPLLGVGAAFFTIAACAPLFGSAVAMAFALVVSILWPLTLALGHLYFNRVQPA